MVGARGTTKIELGTRKRETLLRKAWYTHDARWFSAVAEEFGMGTANRLNRRVVRSIGQTEARRLAREMGMDSAESLNEFLDFVEVGREFYVTNEALEMSISAIDDERYTISVGTCFVAENTQAAGISDTYECAVFDRLQGWHDALGLPLADEDLPGVPCPKAVGEDCVMTLRLRSRPTLAGG
jgi:Family of unknown function (DUF6125)/L-2-amino-thiazoline-4-carboxylic acid hydrolase